MATCVRGSSWKIWIMKTWVWDLEYFCMKRNSFFNSIFSQMFWNALYLFPGFFSIVHLRRKHQWFYLESCHLITPRVVPGTSDTRFSIGCGEECIQVWPIWHDVGKMLSHTSLLHSHTCLGLGLFCGSFLEVWISVYTISFFFSQNMSQRFCLDSK